MKKLDRYNNFTNEGLFSKKKEKSFEDSIKQVDRLFMETKRFQGETIWTKHQDAHDVRITNYKTLKFINMIADIGEKLSNVLLEFGMNMTQDQMNLFIIRFNEFEKFYINRGWRLNDYSGWKSVRNNANSILEMLGHIKNIYKLEIEVDPEKFDNPLVFYKENGYFYIVHKSWLKIKEKEDREIHKGVDPYGEEDWSDEKKNEGVKWYKKGEFSQEESIDDVVEYNDFIKNDKFRDFLIENDVYDIYIRHTHGRVKNNWNEYWKERPDDALNWSLSWSNTPTPRGETNNEFWGRLNKKWSMVYRENESIKWYNKGKFEEDKEECDHEFVPYKVIDSTTFEVIYGNVLICKNCGLKKEPKKEKTERYPIKNLWPKDAF
jgi:hypothetical protein